MTGVVRAGQWGGVGWLGEEERGQEGWGVWLMGWLGGQLCPCEGCVWDKSDKAMPTLFVGQ